MSSDSYPNPAPEPPPEPLKVLACLLMFAMLVVATYQVFKPLPARAPIVQERL